MLEEDVAVLVRATSVRVLRVQGVIAELLQRLPVDHVLEVVEVPDGNLLNLVRGAEAVEEVQERGLAGNGGKVGDGSEVHDLLHVALRQHGKAGLAASHDIGVVTEDVQRLRCDGTCGNVEDAR